MLSFSERQEVYAPEEVVHFKSTLFSMLQIIYRCTVFILLNFDTPKTYEYILHQKVVYTSDEAVCTFLDY